VKNDFFKHVKLGKKCDFDFADTESDGKSCSFHYDPLYNIIVVALNSFCYILN